MRPLSGLSRPASVLLLVYAGVSVVCTLAGVGQIVEYWTVWPSPGELGTTMLISDTVFATLALPQLGLWLASFVLLLMWIHRANKNLATLTGASIGFSPAWAVWCFFVPFLNLLMPYQAVREIWQVSHKGDVTGLRLVMWWWALFLVSRIIDMVAGRASVYAQDTGGYIAIAGASAVASAVVAAASLVGAAMIRRVTAAYSANYDEAAASAAPSGWYSDPSGRHQLRFWTGTAWHAAVADGGAVSHDPLIAPTTLSSVTSAAE